jgi:DNA-binding GntR family transcriptional regulator
MKTERKIEVKRRKLDKRMRPLFKKNKRITLTMRALNQIREAIKSGRFKPGDRVIEGEVAQEMGISRFPVREAIRLLQNEGLLVSLPFKGAFVPEFRESDLEELYTLRSSLEELAIRIFTEKANEHGIKKLESIIAAMDQAAKTLDGEKFVLEDLKFHRTLCQLSGHTKLLEVWMTLYHQLRSFIANEELSYEDKDILVKVHYPLLEAIKSGNPKLAEESIRSHFIRALTVQKEIWRKRKAEYESSKTSDE